MQKYGFREGQGLGKHEQGLSTALSVEKTSKRGGKIIIGDAAEKRKYYLLCCLMFYCQRSPVMISVIYATLCFSFFLSCPLFFPLLMCFSSHHSVYLGVG